MKKKNDIKKVSEKISQLQTECCDLKSDCSRLIGFIEDMLAFQYNNLNKKEEKELHLLKKKLNDIQNTMEEITNIGNREND